MARPGSRDHLAAVSDPSRLSCAFIGREVRADPGHSVPLPVGRTSSEHVDVVCAQPGASTSPRASEAHPQHVSVTTPPGPGRDPDEQEQVPVDCDRSFIRGPAYGNDQKLATRQSIYAFAKGEQWSLVLRGFSSYLSSNIPAGA